MTSKTPPQKPILFADSAASILDEARTLAARIQSVQDEVVQNATLDTASFENVLLPLAEEENRRSLGSSILGFYRHASPDPELRSASTEAVKILDTAAVDMRTRMDVFALVDAVYNKDEHLEPEPKRYLEKTYQEFIYNGANLPDLQCRRFQGLQKQINSLAVTFMRNIREDDSCVWFSDQELSGLSVEFINGLVRGTGEHDGKFRVTTKLPHWMQISQQAHNSETRRRLFMAYNTRCPKNVAIFKEAMILRDEAARILGYENHAALQLQKNMAGNTSTINKFLDDLRIKLLPKGQQRVEELKHLKKSCVESGGQPFDGRFYLWDRSYYSGRMLVEEYSVDHDEIAEYFPLESTTRSMLGIFSHLFGIVFEEVSLGARGSLSTSGIGKDLTWAENVSMYSVWDDHDQGGEFLGYLYLDLIAREGKSDGISCFCLQPGFARSVGDRNYPSAAVLCGFDTPTPTKPTLLEHFQLVSLFHELGHAIHELTSRTQFARFHGTAGPIDFAEGPSQFLENWCWTSSTLKLMSRHYSYISDDYLSTWRTSASEGTVRPSEKIPSDILSRLLSTKASNRSLLHLTMLQFALFDQVVHQPSCHGAIQRMDISLEYSKLRNELMQMDGPEAVGDKKDQTHSESSFTQAMTKDYDATTYGYLFSQVFAYDMYHAFFKDDPMNSTEGRRYRYAILEKGAAQDEMKTVTEYLGREIKNDAFCEELGIAM